MAAAIYNVNRDGKKHPKGWSWLDIFPEARPAPREMDDDEMLMVMEAWARGHRSEVKN